MNIIIRPNDEIEGYDLIDEDSDQGHDGDGDGEWIATVYERGNAEKIKKLLENQHLTGSI